MNRQFSQYFIGFSCIVLSMSGCLETSKSDSIAQEEPTGLNEERRSVITSDSSKIYLKAQYPTLKTCVSDLGVLQMDEHGNSIGRKTEMTELLRLLRDEDCDIISITYEWASSTYDNMPRKIVYNRESGNLKEIYTRTNVIEEYNGVDEAGLKRLLVDGKKNFYSINDYTDATYDFNNREMKTEVVGIKPSQNEWDGSVTIVKNYIKTNSKNRSSIRFIEWTRVIPFGEYWIVRCTYEGTNTLGEVVKESKWFYMQNDEVQKVKTIY